MALDAEHLLLVPWAPRHLIALIDAPERLAEVFGFPAAEWIGESLRGPEVSPVWLATLRSAADAPADPWTYGYALVDRETRQIVGTASFKGPPDGDGMVEIAYGIAPAFRERGLATEAAAALTAHALADALVRVVRAHTLPVANASTRVLAKCGFALLGEVVDPEDGPVWRWEYPAAPPPRPPGSAP